MGGCTEGCQYPCCWLRVCNPGAQGLGLLAASWLGNTLEDFLALTVAGLASYVAVLNLPLKRSDIKAKVTRVANNYADSVTGAMSEVGAGPLVPCCLQVVLGYS